MTTRARRRAVPTLLVASSLALFPVVLGCASAVPEVPAGWHVLAGQVTDGNGRPLSLASVVLSGTPRGALTEEDGTFAIDRLRPGAPALTVLYRGYRSEPATLRIPVPENTSFTLSMSPDPRAGTPPADSLVTVRVTFRAGR